VAVERRDRSSDVGNTCYTNAIDGVGDARWIVRDNFIHDIRCQDLTLAGPAILLWQGSSDTLVERNTITDSSRGIAFGLNGPNDHTGGIARNNFIRWDPSANYAVDVPIYTTSPNAKLLNNTALTSGKYPNAIEVRYASVNRREADQQSARCLDNGARRRNTDVDQQHLQCTSRMVRQSCQRRPSPHSRGGGGARARFSAGRCTG